MVFKKGKYYYQFLTQKEAEDCIKNLRKRREPRKSMEHAKLTAAINEVFREYFPTAQITWEEGFPAWIVRLEIPERKFSVTTEIFFDAAKNYEGGERGYGINLAMKYQSELELHPK